MAAVNARRPASAMDVYAKRLTMDAVAEKFRRHQLHSAPPQAEERVRIRGLQGRLASLNGRYGSAGPLEAGQRRVAVEGLGGAAYRIAPRYLSSAPPRPVEVFYNVGKGAFEPQTYGSDARPRRLRAGSGRPAYSSCKREAEPIAPPVAGSLLPRNDPPTTFHEAWVDGTLPVRLCGHVSGALRWHDPLTGAEVTRGQVDPRRWLPVLIDGIRDAQNAGGAFVALKASIELAGAAGKAGILPALMPSVAPALKAALDLRERSVVCAALRLLLLLLHADEHVGLALRPQYKILLPALAAFRLQTQPSLGDEIERSQHRRINIAELVDECLGVMERRGGEGAGALIKRYVPAYQPEADVLHRGFR
jgi:hypothetical protein